MFVYTSVNQIPERKREKMFGTTTAWILVAVCCLIAIQTATAGESNEQYVIWKKEEEKMQFNISDIFIWQNFLKHNKRLLKILEFNISLKHATESSQNNWTNSNFLNKI